jgi:hypothetical protein
VAATPNNNGRSLEYLIVAALARQRAFALTDRAEVAQSRDKQTVNQIDSKLRNTFTSSAQIISSWMQKSGLPTPTLIDRTSDGDEGVADIILVSKGLHLDFSIKHNSDSLSHPRPYSIAQKCGHAKGTVLDLDHRIRMAKISEDFRHKATRVTKYVDAPKAKQELYVDTCKEVEKTINLAGKHQDAAKILFNSIMGSNFQKIIVETDSASKDLKKILIYDYSEIPQPDGFSTSITESEESCRVAIEFDNQWSLSLRIHTASSRISSTGQLALKFDATTLKSSLPEPTVLFP